MEQVPSWSRAPAPLAWVAAAAGTGLACAQFFPWATAPAAVLGLAAAVVWWHQRQAPALLLVAFGVYATYGYARFYLAAPDDLRRWQALLPRTVELRGIVADEPIPRGGPEGRVEFPLVVEAMRQDGRWQPASGRVLAQFPEGTVLPRCGDRLEAAGFLRAPFPVRNPGEFDQAAFLATRGIHFVWRIDPETVVVTAESVGALGRRLGLAVRDYMRSRVELGLNDDPEISALMAGMLFGYREGIEPEIQEAFRRTGTIHLFAVSGQNVAVITGVLLLILQVTGILRWSWGWALVPIILLFCLGTGLQPSAVRASLMAALVLVAWAWLRPVSPLNLVGAAALMVWTWDPRQLFDLGFQLSFLVVLALIVWAAPLTQFWEGWGRPDPFIPARLVPTTARWFFRGWRMGCAALAVSLAAWAASSPLIAWHFHLVSVIGVVANLVIVPLASLVVILSGLSVVLGTVWSGFAVVFNQVNWLLLHLIVTVVQALSAPSWAAVAWNPAESWRQPHTSIWMLDARAVTPSILRWGKQVWLLEPGSEPVWRWTVEPTRRYLGINRWDGVVLTQASRAAAGGSVGLLQESSVGFWAVPPWRSRASDWQEWLDAMESAGRPKQIWSAGDRIRLNADLEMEVLWPMRDRKWPRSEDQGLVLRLHTPQGIILWAGRISGEVEARLIESGLALQADALVQGPHPLQTNWTQPWLEAVKPRHLIRPRPRFGPDRALGSELWDWVEARGAQLWMMEETGALHLKEKNGRWEIIPYLRSEPRSPRKPNPNEPTHRSPQSWPPHAGHPHP